MAEYVRVEISKEEATWIFWSISLYGRETMAEYVRVEISKEEATWLLERQKEWNKNPSFISYMKEFLVTKDSTGIRCDPKNPQKKCGYRTDGSYLEDNNDVRHYIDSMDLSDDTLGLVLEREEDKFYRIFSKDHMPSGRQVTKSSDWWNKHYAMSVDLAPVLQAPAITPDVCITQRGIPLWHELNKNQEARKKDEVIALRSFIRKDICGLGE